MKVLNQRLIRIWGIKFNLLTMNEFISIVDKRLKQNAVPIHMTGVNPETVVHSSRNEVIKSAILESDYVNVDNAFIVVILKILGYKVPERVATPDLFEELLKYAADNQLKVFILGAKEEILSQAVKNIQRDYSELEVNFHNGYYIKDEEESIITKINSFAPDMLFIALPSPEKEEFILKYKKTLNTKLFLGVGGAVDCRAGIVKRPSKVFGRFGLEGIIRSFQNPLNYGKRYLTFYPVFLKIVIKSIINKN